MTSKRKVSTDGVAKAESKVRSSRLSAKPAPAKEDSKPKNRTQERIKHQTKKVQIKGKREAKGKQAQVADRQTTDLPAENGETESQRQASEEKKEAMSN